ncbi:MAG: class SAM-dependent methyltransferase [Chitinophagaceae bacterium]|nr:class SAM-dependent methyltransferase [Chitinophagaceae bacterium]
MEPVLVNPYNQQPLSEQGQKLVDSSGNEFLKIEGVYKIVNQPNYTDNFGFQWHKFQKTQLDETNNIDLTEDRFFKSTGWDKEDLSGRSMLEVGCGAGRFSEIVLNKTKASLYSLDYSSAVEVNYKNNGKSDRLKLFQASIYEMPFKDNSFDKVFCFGVLQHTPDFKKSVNALIDKAKPGGEIIVDFYPIKGWWTKVHAKYLLRPWTKKMSNEQLLQRIEKRADAMIAAYQWLYKLKLGFLTRFIPICDIKNTFPASLSKEELRNWVILDTFDMFSPEYDNPQKIATVVRWFKERGLHQVKGEFISYGGTLQTAVVRGIK